MKNPSATRVVRGQANIASTFRRQRRNCVALAHVLILVLAWVDSTDAFQEEVRKDLFIGGVYPHLTTYGVYSQNGAHFRAGHNECGIGAVVPWAGRLWFLNYAPHRPQGSEHKLYSIGDTVEEGLQIHPESVGGTHAGRMIHPESNQLLIGPYAIDSTGHVRAIPPEKMPIRITAIARHLVDPSNLAYYIDMEGSIWEVNVHSLEPTRLFEKPVPGWHAKGGYSGQGRLVVSNNGELAVGNYDQVLVGGVAKNDDERGVLAEWNGRDWRIIERRQFTDITGPAGLAGGGDVQQPIWAIGWDKRSLRLNVLDNGNWHTYLLPKASRCNDARHGWYTEWPRIRALDEGRWMMDMHSMFFEFPETFSPENSGGIRPIATHLRYVPDFCLWNNRLVLASNETSIQENPLAGQPQSNLWFGTLSDLRHWGPTQGYGGPWMDDSLKADVPSEPFLIAGFERRMVHLTARSTAATEAETQEKNVLPFRIEVDERGDGGWRTLAELQIESGGSASYLFEEDLTAEWARIVPEHDCLATGVFHLGSSGRAKPKDTTAADLFAGLVTVGSDPPPPLLLYPAKINRNLQLLLDGEVLEFTKAQFAFQPGSIDSQMADPELADRLAVESQFGVDKASVTLQHRDQVLRFPKGDPAFDTVVKNGQCRELREVESERMLANVHGTFYEVPLVTNGAPPDWYHVRPVASHDKWISDYCSWNGLLVLAGVRPDAAESNRVFQSPDNACGLWFGGIDDLWQLGQPRGQGGPWYKTQATKDVPSDPYLMAGYIDKSVTLVHESSEAVTITLEIDISGDGHWVEWRAFTVPQGESIEYEFPDGFSAFWVRARCDRDAVVSVQFQYN